MRHAPAWVAEARASPFMPILGNQPENLTKARRNKAITGKEDAQAHGDVCVGRGRRNCRPRYFWASKRFSRAFTAPDRTVSGK